MVDTVNNSLEIAADLFAVRELGPWLRDLVSSVVSEHGSDEIVGPIELALHELCINIVEHSYRGTAGSIQLSGERVGDQLVFTVRDLGYAFDGDLGNVRETQEHTIRGYGLAILQQLAASLAYERDGDSNCWRVAFALPASNDTNTKGSTKSSTKSSISTTTGSTNKGMK
jgi:serine/threonine-protein kinase RsbW